MLSPDDVTTRTAYDQVAQDYAETFPDLSAEAEADRRLLAEFASLVTGSGPVLDAGCGTGRVSAHLRGLGLPVVGIDLSTGMLHVARQRHRDLPLAAGALSQLPVRDASTAGVLAWYSVIHTAPHALHPVVAELARVATPGAPVLVAFQSGSGERLDRETAFGRPVRRTNYRHSVDAVAQLMDRVGVPVTTSVVRPPAAHHETTPQAFVLGIRRP